MPRLARIVAPNYPHHIVQRGNNRQRIFFDDEDHELYLELLKRYVKECECWVNTHCLMPNHTHMILVPSQADMLAKVMQKLSLRYTQCINKKYRRTGRLWECRFYSSLIQKDEHLWKVSRYIERNPVRAKMVDIPAQYKWSSASSIRGKHNDFVIPIWHNETEKEEYISYVNAPDEESDIIDIRKSTFKGIPSGTKEFIEKMIKKLGVALPTRSKGRPRKEK